MSLPKENTLAIVLAHGKVAETVARHLPQWQKFADQIIFFTPADDPLPSTYWQYSLGSSKAYSADTNRRCRAAFGFAALSHYEYVLVFEYDSLIFGDSIPERILPPRDGISAPGFMNADPKFKGSMYLHFPQLYTHAAMQATFQAMRNLPDDAEHGFTDRFVGLAVEEASCVPVFDLNPTGFVCTHNEIDEKKLPDVLEKYKAGARWSHGVKTKEVFQALAKASFE